MSHYGFNVQWMYNHQTGACGPDERVLDAVVAWGFTFIRLPTDYRLWSVGGDPHRPSTSPRRSGCAGSPVTRTRQ